MAEQPSDPSGASIIYTAPDQLRSRSVAEMHEYWRSKRHGRRMPAPADIDPTEIPHLLPSIVISEYVGDPMRVRYRLVGTLQVYYAGFDFTGLHLDELDWGAYNAFVHQVHTQIRATAAPVFGRYAWEFRDKVPGFVEFGSFPLSEDGTRAARCLSMDDFQPVDAPADTKADRPS